ncbi:MAG: membrane protein insertase YidC, partial [Cyclobacteriaceae bacterium]
AIIANEPFSSGYAQTTVNMEDTVNLKRGEIQLQIPVGEGQSPGFTYYFGPNNFQIMKKVTDAFTENINLGWPPISYVNKFLIIPIFQFLEKYITNYGIIIFILVIIIRIILFPLSYKSHVSMAKTRILKPEIDALKEKHGDDMQKIQAEQMQLYQKAGVNPLSGCIPMLLQMPILFAMFYFFPNSIELRQESFLWADDLSTYDSFITFGTNVPLLGGHLSLFTVLMTISTIGYTWMNNQVTAVSGPMKNIGYIMPIVFLFVLNSFSSALTYYYFLSNIFSFVQQAVIKQFVDDDKLKRIMEENKLKNKSKKKSMFQARLEEAMKAKEETKTIRSKSKGKK